MAFPNPGTTEWDATCRVFSAHAAIPVFSRTPEGYLRTGWTDPPGSYTKLACLQELFRLENLEKAAKNTVKTATEAINDVVISSTTPPPPMSSDFGASDDVSHAATPSSNNDVMTTFLNVVGCFLIGCACTLAFGYLIGVVLDSSWWRSAWSWLKRQFQARPASSPRSPPPQLNTEVPTPAAVTIIEMPDDDDDDKNDEIIIKNNDDDDDEDETEDAVEVGLQPLEVEVRPPVEGPLRTEALEGPPQKLSIELDLSDDRLLRPKPGREYITPRRGN